MFEKIVEYHEDLTKEQEKRIKELNLKLNNPDIMAGYLEAKEYPNCSFKFYIQSKCYDHFIAWKENGLIDHIQNTPYSPSIIATKPKEADLYIRANTIIVLEEETWVYFKSIQNFEMLVQELIRLRIV